ncbi:hypothetical protein DXG01_016997 [Tephrocybe rancida]|nr:hypothetical protein DXG01_016997 [Tephrocybe rancida]
MPDCSVYVKVINKTDLILKTHGVSSQNSEWLKVPDQVDPNGSASFQLKDTTWFEGSDGEIVYTTFDKDRHDLGTEITLDVADPYSISKDNEVQITVNPGSAPRIFAGSFRASVEDDEHYENNHVEPRGHPVYAEFTIDYSDALKKTHKFQLIQITTDSTHPVRNTNKELRVGKHTLWDSNNPSAYKDKNGSLEPNVYGYNFDSPVKDTGNLQATVRPFDEELSGLEAYLIGTVENEIVFKSDSFFFKGTSDDVVVTARAVKPETSKTPFSINADVDWGAKLVLTDKALGREPEGLKGLTRLELYWIAETLHPAFAEEGLPVAFLRSYVPSAEMQAQANPNADVLAVHSQWYQAKTSQTFYHMNKRYDVVAGAAKFDVAHWGGIFAADRFLEGDGVTFPEVNCMDLAAAVQLACSILTGKETVTWLYLSPFGFIEPTKLIGITDSYGALIDVNNPFFGKSHTQPLVNPQAAERTSFGCHVFAGHSSIWKHENDDGIYDACCQPHLGTENIRDYITFAIDNAENKRRFGGGAEVDYRRVMTGYGVYQINRQPTYPPGHDTDMETHSAHALSASQLVSQLLNTDVDRSSLPLAHINWDCLPTWLKSTLGDAWHVQYEEISVGKHGVAAFWQISATNARHSPISVQLRVFSVPASNGDLDVEGSSAAARQHVTGLLQSTQRDDAWTVGNLAGLGAALQYADHIESGRTIHASRNVVVDITGTTSTEALLPTALKLLNQTAHRDLSGLNSSPPVLPVFRRQSANANTSDNGALAQAMEEGTITVTGIHTHFSVVFVVSCKVATASGGSQGGGVLFDRYIAKELPNGKGSTVEFLFISHKLGRHPVRVCVAESKTLLSVSFDLEVQVVDA